MAEEAKNAKIRHNLIYQDLVMVPEKQDINKSTPGQKHNLRGKRTDCVDPSSLLCSIQKWGRKRVNQVDATMDDSDYYIKMCVVITMYNEDVQELKDTMKGVITSIYELQEKIHLEPQDICIFLIADGFKQVRMSKGFLEFMKEYGFYDENLIPKEYFNEEEEADGSIRKDCATKFDWDVNGVDSDNPLNNVIHLFQSETRSNMDLPDIQGIGQNVILPTYNFFFGIKHLNGGKIDSHLYYFRGFCEYLNPKYTFLLDIGTQPLPKSLSVLYQYLENHDQCSGVCGEIEVDTTVDKKSTCLTPSYFLVIAQFVEYKLSNFVDKAFETLFGFVSVLPGAFSGYRWKAINGPPLVQYFKGLDKTNLTCFQSNMYLAEDRIMCLSIVVNTERNDTLAYVPGAVAVTDPPKSLEQFMKQRRRWINGSNFASFYVLSNCYGIFKSRHSKTRKFAMFFLFLYYFLNSLLTWILVGSFYATFSILLRATFPADDTDKIGDTANTIENIYIMCLLLTTIWALCKAIQKSGFLYCLVTVIFGLGMYLSYFTLVQYFISEETKSTETAFAIIIILGSYFLPTLLNIHRINHGVVFIGGLFAYLFLAPFYINVLVIYSFCNTHDVR